MGKTLVIGDTHLMNGLILPMVDKHIQGMEIENIVFTGDYCDQWNQTNNPELYFKDLQFLINWKEKKEEQGFKVTCLLGNHDIPYLVGMPVSYTLSGDENQEQVKKLLLRLRPQISCWSSGFLISHGGYLGETTIEDWHQIPLSEDFDYNNSNHELWMKLTRVVAEAGRCRGGFSSYGSPVWADAKNEFPHYPSNIYFHQCVGHSPVAEVRKISKEGAEIICIDTFSLTLARFSPYYHPLSPRTGVVLLENKKHTVIPVPEWNELPEETFLNYFEEILQKGDARCLTNHRYL